MFYIKDEYDDPELGHIVVVHIHSACCKEDVKYLEVEKDKVYRILPSLDLCGGGIANSIIYAKMKGMRWPLK